MTEHTSRIPKWLSSPLAWLAGVVGVTAIATVLFQDIAGTPAEIACHIKANVGLGESPIGTGTPIIIGVYAGGMFENFSEYFRRDQVPTITQRVQKIPVCRRRDPGKWQSAMEDYGAVAAIWDWKKPGEDRELTYARRGEENIFSYNPLTPQAVARLIAALGSGEAPPGSEASSIAPPPSPKPEFGTAIFEGMLSDDTIVRRDKRAEASQLPASSIPQILSWQGQTKENYRAALGTVYVIAQMTARKPHGADEVRKHLKPEDFARLQASPFKTDPTYRQYLEMISKALN